MLVSTFVPRVGLKASGKVPTYVTGSTKWLKIIAIANQYIDTWAREPGVEWGSLYNPALTVTTVTATDTFAIPTTVRKLSDRPGDTVRILHTGGVSYTDYDIVPHDDLKMLYAGQTKQYPDGYYCAQIGSNLVFNHTFVSTDPQFGGTIKAPVYTFPASISADTDVIPVDDPMWLVIMTAAEYVRNDITKQAQYPNLINEANQLMVRMREDNEAQQASVFMPWNPTGFSSDDEALPRITRA